MFRFGEGLYDAKPEYAFKGRKMIFIKLFSYDLRDLQ